MADDFSIRFWGVRGSYPVAGRGALKYGGNTSCVEVNAGPQRLIFDAGTGIIGLGKELERKTDRPLSLNLLLSHAHHDHLMGFYFFEPFFQKGNRVHIFGPGSGRHSLEDTLRAAMDPALFPLGLDDLPAKKVIHTLNGGERIAFHRSGPAPLAATSAGTVGKRLVAPKVLTMKSAAHPNGVMLYRVIYRGKSVVYATDIEEKPGGFAEVIEFAKGADVLIHDAQYLEPEYARRKGWGHSTMQRAVDVARKAGVRRLALFHHEPTHDDRCIDAIAKRAQRLFPTALAAAEGLVIRV